MPYSNETRDLSLPKKPFWHFRDINYYQVGKEAYFTSQIAKKETQNNWSVFLIVLICCGRGMMAAHKRLNSKALVWKLARKKKQLGHFPIKWGRVGHSLAFSFFVDLLEDFCNGFDCVTSSYSGGNFGRYRFLQSTFFSWK